jgi:hypothetical protein
VADAIVQRSPLGRTLVSRPRQPLALHGCIRDADPDAWCWRAINLRRAPDPNQHLSELTYLRESGTDRIGALDFQDSPRQYEPRGDGATLEQLLAAAEPLDAGEPLPPDLRAAAACGTSIVGARPKALLTDEWGLGTRTHRRATERRSANGPHKYAPRTPSGRPPAPGARIGRARRANP